MFYSLCSLIFFNSFPIYNAIAIHCYFLCSCLYFVFIAYWFTVNSKRYVTWKQVTLISINILNGMLNVYGWYNSSSFYILYYLKFKSIFRNHLQEQQMEFPMDYVKEAFSTSVKTTPEDSYSYRLCKVLVFYMSRLGKKVK